jgi:hypothetical protein
MSQFDPLLTLATGAKSMFRRQFYCAERLAAQIRAECVRNARPAAVDNNVTLAVVICAGRV